MTNKKSTTKATARQELPSNIPTKPGFYWVKIGIWQPCEVRGLGWGAKGVRVWFLGVPISYTLEDMGLEWGPEIKPPDTPLDFLRERNQRNKVLRSPSAPPDMKKYYTAVMISDEDHERLACLADATGEPMYRVVSRALDLLERLK